MREDQLDLFPRLRVPTLVMNRRDDPVVALETARDLAARIPGARFAALEGDVHIVQFGNPDPVIAAIRAFVDAPSRRAPDAATASASPPSGAPPAPLGLSPREVEVLRLLAAGLEQPGDRRAAIAERPHGRAPRGQPLHQARHPRAGRGDGLRPPPRPAATPTT